MTKITHEITHDDLVDLLSTAGYGSSFIGYDYKDEDYYGTPLEDVDDCYEDKLAKILLNDKKIFVTDACAEDEDDFNGKLPHKFNGLIMRYEVGLNDIAKGIAKAIDNGGWDAECAMDLINKNGNLDLYEAENLMQIIVFGEAIYG